MIDIVKYDKSKDLQAPSFINGIGRDKQTNAIVQLITRCVKEQKVINIDEILNCYLDVIFWHKHIVKRFGYYNEEGKWINGRLDRDECLKYRREDMERRAKNWFMLNLAAAIIKGKLLVIPLIEI